MARTYDALIRAEQIRQQGQGAQPAPSRDAELLERIAALEDGVRGLAAQLPRELAEAEERLLSRMGEEIRGLEERRSRAERQLALEIEGRLDPLQRRLTRAALALGALLLWILLRQ
jgi:hypothetical protein